MLAIKKTNMNNILNKQQLSLLPTILWKRVEYMLEKNVLMLIQYMRRETKLIKIVDTDNNILSEIVIDDSYDECIKLSSDGNYLIYINNNNSIVYYNINNNIMNNNVINISSSGIFPKYYYFDRNGLYYVISNTNETMVFDLKQKTLMYTLPIGSIINLISNNYKKIMCRSNDYMKVYDFNNGNELFSIELNHLEMGYMSPCGNHIFYKKEDNINIINNNNIIINYIEDEIIGIAFHPNNIYVAFYIGPTILVIDMNTNKIIKELNDDTYDENKYDIDEIDYEMEFTQDGQYLIVNIGKYNTNKLTF